MNKKNYAILLLITILANILVLPQYAYATEEKRTLGEDVAEKIFKVDELNEKIFTIKDREMFIELLHLIDSLGAGVNTAKGFMSFLNKNIYGFGLDRMKKYLMEDDKESFSEAINEREAEFRNEMEEEDVDLDKIDESLEGLGNISLYPTTSPTTSSKDKPTPSAIIITSDKIPKGSINILVDIMTDGNKVSGSMNIEKWNKTKKKLTENTLIFCAKSGKKNIEISEFTFSADVYNEILENDKIKSFVLSTDNSIFKAEKDILKDSLNDFLKNDSEEVKSTASIKFESSEKVIDSQMSDLFSNEQKKLLKGNTKYFDINIYLSKINQSGELVTKKLNSNDTFKKEIEISLPYDIKREESADLLTVFYIGDSGITQNMQGIYSDVNKLVKFKTKHLSIYVPMVYAKMFSDVLPTNWAKDYICKMVSKGIIQGTSEETFAPSKYITRAEFSTLLIRLLKSENMDITDVKNNFLDINGYDWYYKNVIIAAKLALIKGYKNNTFKPNQDITREELAVMILRITGDSISNYSFNNLTYEDKENVSEYAKDAVAKIYGAGIMVGKTGNKFDPKGNATRAETVKVMSILFNLLRN